jgi:hypothetical protein
MSLAILMDFSCTKTICGPLQEELWPSSGERPKVIGLPVSAAGSSAHERYVQEYRASHGGEFLTPFLEENGAPADATVAVIGFSAGCWGLGEILKEEGNRVALAYAIDGLHGRYQEGRAVVGEHWLAYARRAAAGECFLLDSHSAIVPPGYPGTEETARALLAEFGVDYQRGSHQGGLDSLLSDLPIQCCYRKQGLMVFGAWNGAGNDAAAHIYQANGVQEAVWRGVIAPWSAGALPGAGLIGGQLWKLLAFGAGVAGGYLAANKLL